MTAVDDNLPAQIASAAKAELKDCAKYLFFDEAGTVLGANFKVRRARCLALETPGPRSRGGRPRQRASHGLMRGWNAPGRFSPASQLPRLYCTLLSRCDSR
jgi:hypothetical protein